LDSIKREWDQDGDILLDGDDGDESEGGEGNGTSGYAGDQAQIEFADLSDTDINDDNFTPLAKHSVDDIFINDDEDDVI
jgi:hypothetical protein